MNSRRPKKYGGDLNTSSAQYNVTMERSGNDHIYYNVVIFNTDYEEYIPATYTNFSTDIILDKPEDYEATIIRFNINGLTLPIFYYPNYLLNGGPFGADDTIYLVTLSYLGNYYQQNVIFVSDTPTLPLTNLDYYAVTSYRSFIKMVNTALSSAFNTLKAANPGAPMTQPPFLYLDSSTNLISLVIQKQYLGNSEIYMNTALFEYFSSFSWSATRVPTRELQFNLYNNNVNGFSTSPVNLICGTTLGSNVITSAGLFTISLDGNTVSGPGIPQNSIATYVNPNTINLSQNATATATANLLFINQNLYELKQEYVSLGVWSDINGIVITSSSIPSTAEFITSPPPINSGVNANVISQSNSVKILTDFIPNITANPADLFANIDYFTTGEYRMIDLCGSVPLTTLDVQFQWRDNIGNLFPLYISPRKCASLKILFRKKKYKVSFGDN